MVKANVIIFLRRRSSLHRFMCRKYSLMFHQMTGTEPLLEVIANSKMSMFHIGYSTYSDSNCILLLLLRLCSGVGNKNNLNSTDFPIPFPLTNFLSNFKYLNSSSNYPSKECTLSAQETRKENNDRNASKPLTYFPFSS